MVAFNCLNRKKYAGIIRIEVQLIIKDRTAALYGIVTTAARICIPRQASPIGKQYLCFSQTRVVFILQILRHSKQL